MSSLEMDTSLLVSYRDINIQTVDATILVSASCHYRKKSFKANESLCNTNDTHIRYVGFSLSYLDQTFENGMTF
jgi:hypothetical protein